MKKRLSLAIISLIFTIFPAFAQEQNIWCENRVYEIKWLSDIKKWQSSEYSIIRAENKYLWSISFKSINTVLKKNDRTIQRSNSDFFLFTPNELGTYTLNIDIVDQENCSSKITKEINVHDKIILYLWKENPDLHSDFDENFQKHNTLFKKSILKEKVLFGEEDFTNQITENIPYIKNSSTIIINSNNFDSLFQILWNINKSENLNLDKKDIYITTDLNKYFLKRTLAKYMNIIWIHKIQTINEKDLFWLVSKLSFNKELEEDQSINSFSLLFQETPKYLIISYLVDNLIYQWFPIDLIWILLILCIATLVISVFRQVIWFSVFGIYSPLLFGVAMAMLGIKLSLFFLAIGVLAKLITDILSKKIYLLFNAKLSILVVFYFLFTIVVIGLDKILNINLINLDFLNNSLVIFPIIFIIIVTDKVFSAGFKVLSLGRWFSLLEFMLVGGSVYLLLNWWWLKHWLLSYPEIILIILFLHVIIGRFTWLQLLEHFRFMPLIRRQLDNEEE